ncbi:hypothetical protein [Scytonema sp. NUACC21]
MPHILHHHLIAKIKAQKADPDRRMGTAHHLLPQRTCKMSVAQSFFVKKDLSLLE